MTYVSGAKKMWEIIDDIAAGLIASPGGYWTNADTTWDTTVKTGNSARRALKYLNGSEEFYVALEMINTSTQYMLRNSYGYWYYAKGLRIVVSATWDDVGHTYPASNQSTLIPFQGNAYNTAVTADMATLQVTYYLWYETNGFVLLGKPEPSADTMQQSFTAVIERNVNKEYSDGFTNFYVMAICNNHQYYDGAEVTSINRFRGVLRPFAYQYPDTPSGDIPTGTDTAGFGFNGNGISFVGMPTNFAYKSSGNGKAYYVKPIIHNGAGQIIPIFQSELWFPWSEAAGLIDGDVIAVEGQTTKFLCKSLDSPDYITRVPIAIKYVA